MTEMMQSPLPHALSLGSHKSLVLVCFLDSLKQNNFSSSMTVNMPPCQKCSL